MIKFYVTLEQSDVDKILSIVGDKMEYHLHSSCGMLYVVASEAKIQFRCRNFYGSCRVEEIQAGTPILLR